MPERLDGLPRSYRKPEEIDDPVIAEGRRRQLQNLKGREDNPSNFANISPETRMEYTRRGHAKSAETKRRNNLFRKQLNLLLDAGLPDTDSEVRAQLESLGMPNATQRDALLLTMLVKAREGDVRAAEFIRDTVGEKPVHSLEVAAITETPVSELDLSSLSDSELDELLAEADTPEQLSTPTEYPALT